jgi:hypothetical protein
MWADPRHPHGNDEDHRLRRALTSYRSAEAGRPRRHGRGPGIGREHALLLAARGGRGRRQRPGRGRPRDVVVRGARPPGRRGDRERQRRGRGQPLRRFDPRPRPRRSSPTRSRPYVRRADAGGDRHRDRAALEPAEVLRVLLVEDAAGRDQATIAMHRRQSGLPAGLATDGTDSYRLLQATAGKAVRPLA